MNRSVYELLKEAAHMANVIEAAESGYIALSEKDVLMLDNLLLEMIKNVQIVQQTKVPGAENAWKLPHKERK